MTQPISGQSTEQLQALAQRLGQEYALVEANTLNLDLSRGKPADDQLTLSEGLEDTIAGDYRASDGTDVRNYGGLRGLPEARELGAELLHVPAEAVIAGGNSSLSLMHLVTHTALVKGLWNDQRRWSTAEAPKLLAVVPGYDRHFTLTEALGIELVHIDITPSGPDMDQVYDAVRDASVKGIWCVPKYSNPTGCVYSDATVQALAQLPLKTAADDFVVLYDNAYAVHDFEMPPAQLLPIYAQAQTHATLDHIVQFASTSKITFAGGGVSFVSSGPTALDALEREMSFMTIGPDKVNQLRHARFLRGRLTDHMRNQAELLRPKFELVAKVLDEDLSGLDIASWTAPKGGYFVSLDVLPGLASTVVQLARSVGLTLTAAGATFPSGCDPNDKNVRIAPTFAAMDDLAPAMRILTLCVKLASVRDELARRDSNKPRQT